MEQENEMKAALEALLFLAHEPLGEDELSQALGLDRNRLEALIQNLQQSYRENTERGVQLERVAGGILLSTKTPYAHFVQKLFPPKVKERITQASLETLAIIAYRQPITRNEIEKIRGVKAEKALLTLIKKGLIQEVGRMETVGTPILYGTTRLFLQHFGLQSTHDLPDAMGLRGRGAPPMKSNSESG